MARVDHRAALAWWLVMLAAAALLIAAWSPARADDGASPDNAQPSSRRTWMGSLRRKSTPPPALVNTDVVSSGARATVASQPQRAVREPLGQFDWGDLGLQDHSPAADTKVVPAQALLPANEQSSPAGDSGPQPSAVLQMPVNELRGAVNADSGPTTDPTAEPQPLNTADTDGPDAAGMRLVQRPTGPTVPPFEEAFGQGQQSLQVDCDVERQKLKPINAVTNKITAEPGAFPPECGIGHKEFKGRDFPPMTYTWVASNLCHKPLYFEQPRLERYGQSLPPVIQPVWSAALFFVTVPLLPYKMGIEPPNECVYVLGYYRPSSCAPQQIPGLPLSWRGAILECSMIAGFAVVLPP